MTDLTLHQWRLIYMVDSLFAASELYPSARELADLIYGDTDNFRIGNVAYNLELLVKYGLLQSKVLSGVTRYSLTAEGRRRLDRRNE
jgi:hypothetical protein